MGVLVVLAAMSCGCVTLRPRPPSGPEPLTGLEGVLNLIGRHAGAQACPIAPDLALTAAHVADLRPWDGTVPLFPYRYSTGAGQGGLVQGVAALRSADLAALRPLTGPFLRWYSVADTAPAAGARVRYLAYDLRHRDDVYVLMVREGRVLRVVAGHVIMDVGGPLGSSGSCVLNDAGEVVGINAWEREFALSASTGVAVGIWGEWAPKVDLEAR